MDLGKGCWPLVIQLRFPRGKWGGGWQDEHKERPLNLLAGRLSLGSLAVVGLGQRKEQREACVGLLRPPRPGL